MCVCVCLLEFWSGGGHQTLYRSGWSRTQEILLPMLAPGAPTQVMRLDGRSLYVLNPIVNVTNLLRSINRKWKATPPKKKHLKEMLIHKFVLKVQQSLKTESGCTFHSSCFLNLSFDNINLSSNKIYKCTIGTHYKLRTWTIRNF